MTVCFSRAERPSGEDIALACIEIARHVSNATGFWWHIVAVGGDSQYVAFGFEPSLWPETVPYPAEI